MAEETAVSTETAKPAPVAGAPEGPETTAAEKPPAEATAPPAKTYTQEEVDRIAQKVKKNAAYRARKEAEAYYKGLQQGTSITAAPAQEKQAPVEDKPPSRESFDSYEAFLDAKADFTGRKAAREERAKGEREETARKAEESRAKLFTDFQSKVRTEFPDIEDRMGEIGHIQMPPGMGDAIAESPNGPKIMDYMADNPKECERIAALSSSAAIREIGRLEARFEAKVPAPTPPRAEETTEPEARAETEPEPKAKPSKAPEPITPVGGKSTDVNAEPDPSKNGGKDWYEWRQKDVSKKRGAGIR